jgi:hypothetical protein
MAALVPAIYVFPLRHAQLEVARTTSVRIHLEELPLNGHSGTSQTGRSRDVRLQFWI